MKILCLDYGKKITGTAFGVVGKSSNIVATSLIDIKSSDWYTVVARVKLLINSYDVDTIIIGNPLNNKNEDSPMSLEIRRFEKYLKKAVEIPTKLVNEYGSTVESASELRKKNPHSLAALYILKNYVNSL